MFDFEEWMQSFRPVWDRWAAKLAVLEHEGAHEHQRVSEDAQLLASQVIRTRLELLGGDTTYILLWEQAFR